MLAIKAAALLAALFHSFSEAAVNYCGAAMCGMTNTHTFCQFTEGPGPKCSGYIEDRLSREEKIRVVDRMNRRRSEAAQGKLQLPPASNMFKLRPGLKGLPAEDIQSEAGNPIYPAERWVEELAREAQIWADQCSPPTSPEEHDVCRDLFAITVGQCVASVVGEAPGLRPETMVDMWYLQGRQGLSMYAEKTSPVDFSQMLSARTYLVGCGRSRFMTEQNGRLRTVTRLVCNFAPRLMEGALWVAGAPASDCPPRSRPDPTTPGLCDHYDALFTYDLNNTTILKEQALLDTILEIERNESLNSSGSLDQIYLTKMMVVSLLNETKQEYQKISTEKDVVDVITPDDTKMSVTVITDTKNIFNNVSTKKGNETSRTRVTKKILNTVGRPKAYNIEDLNSVQKEEPENGTTRAVKEDDYRDYEVDDSLEKKGREPSETEINETTTSITNSVEMENATRDVSIPRSSTYIMSYSSENNVYTYHPEYSDVGQETTPYVQNDILKKLIELSEKTDLNPSDPETAHQLDEALNNMEKMLASPASPASSKVRRELRSQDSQNQETRNDQPSPNKQAPQEQTQSQRIREIGTPDSAPVMAILNKYAPYIKSFNAYESFFKGNDASNTTRSFVLLLLGCLITNSF